MPLLMERCALVLCQSVPRARWNHVLTLRRAGMVGGLLLSFSVYRGALEFKRLSRHKAGPVVPQGPTPFLFHVHLSSALRPGT